MRRVLVLGLLGCFALPATATAGPPFGPIKPTKPKAFPKPKKAPLPLPQPATLQPACNQTPMVVFERFNIAPMLATGDNNLKGRGHLNMRARVRFTKRRIFVEGSMVVREKHTGGKWAAKPGGPLVYRNGNTRYRGSFQIVRTPEIPEGCEIASISHSGGSMTSIPRGSGRVTVHGAGILDEAQCRFNHSHDSDAPLRCEDIALQPIRVTLRPAQVDCRPRTIQHPVWSMRLATKTRGDWDMGGHNPLVGLDSTVQRAGSTQYRMSTRLQIKESVPDHTTYHRQDHVELFDDRYDAPGCRVRSISLTEGRLRGQTRDGNNHDGTIYGTERQHNHGPPAEGNIRSAWCRTDRNGNDRNQIGCGEITFRPVTFTLERR